MVWKSYFFPQVIGRYESGFNRDIRVVETAGQLKLLVHGSPQSGSYIESLWKKAFTKFKITAKNRVRTILVLGVGGGTVIKMLSHFYPAASITAVDIDPKILEIGEKYFQIRSIPNTSYILVDAQDYVNFLKKNKSKFDLVIVDLYSGRDVPDFVASEEFLKSIRALLASEGMVVINYLREKEYRELSDDLYMKLKGLFRIVKDTGIFLNRFFIASKSSRYA